MRNVFEADPFSTWDLLVQQGIGFYIPAYQREYSWDHENIDRVFEDLAHGIHMLLHSDKKDAVTFIGALIVIHDTSYQTIEPHVKGQLPGKVLLVIDGQQRLCTLLILNTLLHEQISITLNKLKEIGDLTNEANDWLLKQAESERQKIRITFEQDMYGEGDYRWYPRIIRAFDDSWSTDKNYAKYTSPIAAYLHGYARFSRNNEKSEFVHEVPNDKQKSKHDIILENYVLIRNAVKKLAAGKDASEFPEIERMVEDIDFQKALFGGGAFENYLVEKLTSLGSEKSDDVFIQLFRLLIFSKYLNLRVAVTLVTAHNEDYAFDMFEALNTTGTPLTAYETFRPTIIRSEELSEFEHSPSRKYMLLVEEYLDQFTDSKSKQDATNRLLIPFALSESGYKLSKRLREQRTHLRQKYEELGSVGEKREFVQHMAHTAKFIKDYWPDKQAQHSLITEIQFENIELVELCISLLRKSNHEITIGLLVTFFAKVNSATSSERQHAIAELERAIKAVTAFWVIWRSTRRSTGSIDARYRQLMEKGVEECSVSPFSRRSTVKNHLPPYRFNPSPTADDLNASLKHFLAGRGKEPSIRSQNDWIRYALEIPFYTSVPNPITRFLLLLSSHDTECDSSDSGLLISGRNNTLPMLTMEQWNNNNSIEHIAPKSHMATGWESNLYEDPDLVHQIGNLTLLPPQANSLAADRPWEHKRLIYSIFAATTQQELDSHIDAAKHQGIEFNEKTEDLLKGSEYLAHVRSVSLLDKNWTSKFVKRRSERLLQLAWEKLAIWLDF